MTIPASIPISKLTKEEIESLKPGLVDGLSSLDMDGVAKYIKNKANKIILMIGAGLSTAAGIPDFRTPGTGLYYNLQKFNLPTPESVFSIDYFDQHPEAFFQLAKDTLPGRYKPTKGHYFCTLLQRKGILKKIYTQNIDGLEACAGVSPEKIIYAHGSYYTSHCRKCHKLFKLEDIRSKYDTGEVIHCDAPNCDGVVKPDVVFFGESLPDEFYDNYQEDFDECDLLIVIGTSLVVYPFAGLIHEVKDTVPRVLINNQKVATCEENVTVTKDENGKLTAKELRTRQKFFKFDHILNRRDVYLGGDCQKAISDLVEAIGWSNEFEALVNEKNEN
ncbi:NAD-dependent protein deacetylase sirtuin-2 [Histomonas meleagridis]|uniref:NAD-dependent protein deacetylase sirtuin-2 n=1 Tax=Histomonas meleagridis TaxID=135588 RepID=UPI00355A0B30|nr:NAD-dependent protein deacetylase sirtuin-2 [Histomonas meleagridis]KAH0799478.1 NAD-dependent protein deacetylase sirtuin-2 [Histomonas meleagridis]